MSWNAGSTSSRVSSSAASPPRCCSAIPARPLALFSSSERLASAGEQRNSEHGRGDPAADPDSAQQLGGEHHREHHPDQLIATRGRLAEEGRVEAGQGPEREQAGEHRPEPRRHLPDPDAGNPPDAEAERDHEQRPAPVERAHVHLVAGHRQPERVESLDASPSATYPIRVWRLWKEMKVVASRPQPRYQSGVERGRDHEHERAPEAIAGEREVDEDHDHERHPEARPEKADREQDGGDHVPAPGPRLERQERADAARDRAEERHLEREQEVVPGGAEEEDRHHGCQRQPSVDAPAQVDEQEHDVGDEQSDRDHLGRGGRFHPEHGHRQLIDADRGGQQVLDEGIEIGLDVEVAAVEQEVPLVAPEGQVREPIEQGGRGEQRDAREDQGRGLGLPEPPSHQPPAARQTAIRSRDRSRSSERRSKSPSSIAAAARIVLVAGSGEQRSRRGAGGRAAGSGAAAAAGRAPATGRAGSARPRPARR